MLIYEVKILSCLVPRIQRMHETGIVEFFFRRSLRRRLKYPSKNVKVQQWVRQQQRFHWRRETSSTGHQEVAGSGGGGGGNHRASPLSLSDLQSAYVLAAFGTVLSVAAFALEMLVNFTFRAVVFSRLGFINLFN